MIPELITLKHSRADLRDTMIGKTPAVEGQWVEVAELVEGQACSVWRDEGALCGDGYALLDDALQRRLERVLVADDIEVRLVYPDAEVYRALDPQRPFLVDLAVGQERRPRHELLEAAREAGLPVEPLLYEGTRGVPWKDALDLLCVRGTLGASTPRRGVLYRLSWHGRLVHAALLERPQEEHHESRRPKPILPDPLLAFAGDRDDVRAAAAEIVAARRLEQARAKGRPLRTKKPKSRRRDDLLLPFR